MKTRLGTLILTSISVWAQAPLSLQDAVKMGLEKHPSIAAGEARRLAAGTRIEQARGNWLPKLNYSESFARSNNPVFVFSSLLTQHQFTEQNFAIGPLNRPDFLNNFQSQVTVDQVIYDGGQIRHGVRMARLGEGMAGEDSRRTRQNLIAQVVRAYFGAALAAENLAVAREALKSAQADQARAEAVRAAGMATDADVLSIRVHLAAVREQQIRRSYDLGVARAALNEALGLPLETEHSLTTPLSAATLAELPLPDFEKKALAERPESRQVEQSARLAETQVAAARASMLPQVGVRLAFEADRQEFIRKGGANWLVAGSLKWNLFNGHTDRARVEEARHGLTGARATQTQVHSGIRLQVRQAHANWKAAQERIDVASAAVDMAEESLRITKNRYEAGLTTVTELLRNETAVMEAKTRRLAAIYDQRLAAAMLELAAGTLSEQSEAIR